MTELDKPKQNNPKEPSEEVALKEQFAKSLRANLEHLRRVNPDAADADPELLRQIEAVLQHPAPTWRDFYLAERLLVQLYDEGSLDVEIPRRLAESYEVLQQDHLGQFYQNMADTLKTAKDKLMEKRMVLSRMLLDIQWRDTVKYEKRAYARRIRQRTAFAFILSMGAFITMLVVAYLSMHTNQFGLFKHPNILMMSMAAVAGVWGASFSILLSLGKRLENTHLDDLRVIGSGSFILSRLLIGAGASLVLYFFLKAGLLAGAVFEVSAAGALDETSMSLLVVLSFLAGFSETLVPGMLTKTENKFASSELEPPPPPPPADRNTYANG